MVKGREVFIILFFIAVLGTALYAWAYLRPARERIAELREDITEREARLENERLQAMIRANQYAGLYELHTELSAQWEVEAAALPVIFDDTRVLRHVQSVIYPHTDSLTLAFGMSEEREGDELWSTTIYLEFETSYWQFLSILYNLVQGDLGNRVVNYTFTVTPMDPDDFNERITPVVDDMPDYIRNQLGPQLYNFFYLGNRDDGIVGLYMLEVQMEVEYLSQEAGLLPIEVLLEAWERMDAPPEEEYEYAEEGAGY